jgi:hypothetical protein
MTAQTHSTNQELARARTMRAIGIVLAVLAVAALVYGFGMGWAPWYQVPAGLAAYVAVEWQRHWYKKIKALSGTETN